MDKFHLNISGSTIGSVSIGPGVKISESLLSGRATKEAVTKPKHGAHLAVSIDTALDVDRMSYLLRELADKLIAGTPVRYTYTTPMGDQVSYTISQT